ncbi:hypothetical protein Dsin_026210 [Dipteronia sinensis]|uniref:Uncharacterized protein n=1 Tax=Dipteronia sinensis TaxID=43782 RepID=A0AAD9ZX45_9ROSI|nr:hypothetical protein Dsin_026210 [Dipteronia sinensis]
MASLLYLTQHVTMDIMRQNLECPGVLVLEGHSTIRILRYFCFDMNSQETMLSAMFKN